MFFDLYVLSPMNDDAGFIAPDGNYRELLYYRKAEIVYDLTYRFCHRFLAKTDRTIDQMIQAARSGKQNIVEGSKASGTSKETEIKLTGVARASLDEVLNDYHDLLRVRDLPIWEKESREARFVRQIGTDPDVTFEHYREFCATRSLQVVANIANCLIHQTNYILTKKIRAFEHAFFKQAAMRERMNRARRQHRDRAEA